MPSISVIIPAYNEELYISECIQSILKDKTANVVEVIVVNNASTDATAAIAGAYSGVSVVHEPKKGLTAARQKGLESSKGDLLAFVDADSRIPEGWFTQINDAFAEESLVCLSGPYKFFDLPKVHCACASAYWNFLAYPTYMLTKYMVVGGNFVAKRSALLSINGFDTSIPFYGEDADIGRRLHEQGKVRFKPSFYVRTSGRRLTSQGMIKTGAIYISNFLSEALFHKAITKKYTDIR